MTEPADVSKDEDDSARRARRRRAEALLGDLLPTVTGDESGPGWGDHEGGTSRDEQIAREVPPHHGAD